MDGREDRRVDEFMTECPSCGYKHDSHSAIGDDDASPDPGSISICLACGDVSIYAGEVGALYLREATQEEREEILKDSEIVRAMTILRDLKSIRKSWPKGPKEAV